MFASNLVEFLNGFIFNRNIWLTKDDNKNLGKENCKQGFDFSPKTKHNSNSISNKFDQLKLFVWGKVDILVITVTELDSIFQTSRFIANHIALIETETGMVFLFERTYKANL